MVTEFNGVMPPNRMAHYIMALVTHGSGAKIIGSHRFDIEPGMAMIFPKRVIHATNRWSLDTTGYMQSFSEALFEETQLPVAYLQLLQLFRLSMKPYLVLDAVTAGKAEGLFRELFQYEPSEQGRSCQRFHLRQRVHSAAGLYGSQIPFGSNKYLRERDRL
jgi:hypothetical protein